MLQALKSSTANLIGLVLMLAINSYQLTHLYHAMTGTSGYGWYVAIAVVDLAIILHSVRGGRNTVGLFCFGLFALHLYYFALQVSPGAGWNAQIIFWLPRCIFASIFAYLPYTFANGFAEEAEAEMLAQAAANQEESRVKQLAERVKQLNAERVALQQQAATGCDWPDWVQSGSAWFKVEGGALLRKRTKDGKVTKVEP